MVVPCAKAHGQNSAYDSVKQHEKTPLTAGLFCFLDYLARDTSSYPKGYIRLVKVL